MRCDVKQHDRHVVEASTDCNCSLQHITIVLFSGIVSSKTVMHKDGGLALMAVCWSQSTKLFYVRMVSTGIC